MRRPFGIDPLTGAQEFLEFEDGKIKITREHSVSNMDAVLRQNYEDRKHTSPNQWGDSWEKDGETFVKFAGIPLDIYYNENIVPKWLRTDVPELVKWLQKPEQEAFKAHHGTFL